jgi:hypothetical protein
MYLDFFFKRKKIPIAINYSKRHIHITKCIDYKFGSHLQLFAYIDIGNMCYIVIFGLKITFLLLLKKRNHNHILFIISENEKKTFNLHFL